MIPGEGPAVIPAGVPSPILGVRYPGPVPVRVYAIRIMIGMLLAVWLTERRAAPRRFMRSGGMFTEHRPPLR
ncbi:MAG TPA: hypothetical protein VJT49_23610 [Amycolatopsis sp.]|uniref:hypothetical protein n=1 Tax=Amycolatopsis sp. TaxID=37632 RepID=UPI002B482557|nr:hypothetical protein [Amycolatopsis sp.]HKS48042.1 hypothetical protein [Amycolatopsis sp.]